MLIFYYARGTCALAVHIALEDAGADYEARRVDFAKAEQRTPEYLKINPKGRVPALATARGVLTETPALLVYIAQTHPAGAAGAARRSLRLGAGPGLRGLSLLHRPCRARPSPARQPLGGRAVLARGHEAQDARQHARVLRLDRAARCFAAPGRWARPIRSIDPYLFTLAGWLPGHGVDVGEFPAVADHFARMSARDSVKRALAAEQA